MSPAPSGSPLPRPSAAPPPDDAAIRRAQEIIARYIPPNSGLVDKLIDNRRDEAARE